jgi:hypothetical protein
VLAKPLESVTRLPHCECDHELLGSTSNRVLIVVEGYLGSTDRYIPMFLILVAMIASIIYITRFVNNREKQWQGMYNPEVESQKQFMKDTVKPLK